MALQSVTFDESNLTTLLPETLAEILRNVSVTDIFNLMSQSPRLRALIKENKRLWDLKLQQAGYFDPIPPRSSPYELFITHWTRKPHIWRNDSGKIINAAKLAPNLTYDPFYWIQLSPGQVKVKRRDNIEVGSPPLYIQTPGSPMHMIDINTTLAIDLDLEQLDIRLANDTFDDWWLHVSGPQDVLAKIGGLGLAGFVAYAVMHDEMLLSAGAFGLETLWGIIRTLCYGVEYELSVPLVALALHKEIFVFLSRLGIDLTHFDQILVNEGRQIHDRDYLDTYILITTTRAPDAVSAFIRVERRQHQRTRYVLLDNTEYYDHRDRTDLLRFECK